MRRLQSLSGKMLDRCIQVVLKIRHFVLRFLSFTYNSDMCRRSRSRQPEGMERRQYLFVPNAGNDRLQVRDHIAHRRPIPRILMPHSLHQIHRLGTPYLAETRDGWSSELLTDGIVYVVLVVPFPGIFLSCQFLSICMINHLTTQALSQEVHPNQKI